MILFREKISVEATIAFVRNAFTDEKISMHLPKRNWFYRTAVLLADEVERLQAECKRNNDFVFNDDAIISWICLTVKFIRTIFNEKDILSYLPEEILFYKAAITLGDEVERLQMEIENNKRKANAIWCWNCGKYIDRNSLGKSGSCPSCKCINGFK